MKTEPTDIDREAARLFTPAEGMRIILEDRLYGGEWARISVAGAKMSGCYERGSHTWDACCDTLKRCFAIDTDDPATVGVMLAQVRATYRDPSMTTSTYRDGDDTRWWVMHPPCSPTRERTEGAALVSVMRALRATP